MSLLLTLKKTLRPKTVKRFFIKLALAGKTVECVCCNKSYITFLPAGLQLRPNATCPNCSSLERHRALWLFLQKETNFFTKKIKILHVAPEQYFYEKFMQMPNIEYVAVDKYPDSYSYNNKTIEMDITDIKYPDNSFDVVMCNHVLEHIPDDAKAMSEMCRVMKKDGWAILNVPVDSKRETTFEIPDINDPEKQLELFGQKDHVRVYGKDYLQRLKNAGFVPHEKDYVGSFTHNDQFKYGFQKGEHIYYCTKQ
jgi:SAM-dependent methyltransferase